VAIVLVLVKGVERKMRVRFLVLGFGFLIYLFFWERGRSSVYIYIDRMKLLKGRGGGVRFNNLAHFTG